MKIEGKALAIFLVLAMVFTLSPLAAVPAYGTVALGSGAQAGGNVIDLVVSGNESPFTVNGDWLSRYGITDGRTNVTIKLDGVSIESTTQNVSGITIAAGFEVTLIFDGNCTITGCSISSSNCSAGIKVENGATLNIYGEDGANLTVTGGRYGAGIGGAGYSDGNQSNPVPGTINIYSGTITARGGGRGAGIGSGYKQSGGIVNIYGGNITAIGTGWGAGIGSGYGSSGGANNPPAGSFSGGTINIRGGVVRAATNDIDFVNLDYYNLEDPLYGNLDVCAAGIGGGYGSTSGNITISGDADVIAVGSCGGAGIGSGRGTDRVNQYSQVNDISTCVPCNITIEGNANVVALAGKDIRNGPQPVGGAGIGSGYGFGLTTDAPGAMGDITITGAATVLAHAGGIYADGIGSSLPVGTVNSQMQRYYDNRATANIEYGLYVDVRAFMEGIEVFTTRHVVNAVNGQVDGSIYRINGDTVTVSAIVPAGKTFEGWQSDEVTFADASSAITTFTMPATAVTVSALLQDIPTDDSSRQTTNRTKREEKPEEEVVISFDDINGDEWFAESVFWVAKRGIMTGTGDGKFMPNLLANRAQIAQLLYNMDGAKQVGSLASFRDVRSGDWYAKSVSWLIESAIAQGMGESFGALENVSREQLAVMLYNYAKLKGYDVSLSSSIDSFEDSASVSPWAKDAVSWAVESGIIAGTSYGYGSPVLDPQGSATRAQIAVMIERFCEKVVK
jgi:hypothetical protein